MQSRTEAALALDHAEVDVDPLAVHGDRQRGFLPTMELEELTVVERREDVAVHDDEAALQIGHGP